MTEMSDKELITFALDMWANYIETGFVHLSAESQKGNFPQKELNLYQKELVLRLRKLAINII